MFVLRQTLVDMKLQFSEEFLMQATFQLAVGLAYMHSNHIAHRDIKPSNIFLTGDGLFKVRAFHPSESRSRMAQTGDTKGTTGAHSFIRAGKKCTLALISWVWKKLLLRFRGRGEAGRG